MARTVDLRAEDRSNPEWSSHQPELPEDGHEGVPHALCKMTRVKSVGRGVVYTQPCRSHRDLDGWGVRVGHVECAGSKPLWDVTGATSGYADSSGLRRSDSDLDLTVARAVGWTEDEGRGAGVDRSPEGCLVLLEPHRSVASTAPTTTGNAIRIAEVVA